MKTLRLFLFDLDGTLVSTGGAGMRALDAATEFLYGVKNVMHDVDPSGKTDPAIFREIITRFVKPDPASADLERLAAAYLARLEENMSKLSTLAPLPGVAAWVDDLSRRDDVALALGTGNLERGARLKLAPTGLNPYFTVGGYGSDAEDRAEMLRVGRRRAEAIAGRSAADEDVWVVGDTVRDIAAARGAGFRVLAVATGGASRAVLEAARPDVLLDDLTSAPDWFAGTEARA